MKNQEKLFLLILLISILFNMRQCSKSKDFDIEILIREDELLKLEGELIDARSENARLIKPEETKKTPSRVKKSVPKPVEIKLIDSIVAPVLNDISDTTKTIE